MGHTHDASVLTARGSSMHVTVLLQDGLLTVAWSASPARIDDAPCCSSSLLVSPLTIQAATERTLQELEIDDEWREY